MRALVVCGGMLLVAALVAACTRPCYVTECDLQHYRDLMPPRAECDPAASIVPAGTNAPAPATPDDPERTIRYISLSEVIALALEQGIVGSAGLTGTTSDALVAFGGGGVASGEDPIRVLALDPAGIATNIEASLAKFDARWISSMTWSNSDLPAAVTPAGVIPSATNGENATFLTELVKPLPTGGVAGITFRTDYTDLIAPAAGANNPTYRPTLQFNFEQPLLQGFGVEINQLRASHPGSLLTPFAAGGRVEGVLITRIRFDQQRAEFERQVHILLANAEIAYWNLYASYGALYAAEQGLRQAYEAWNLNRQRFNIGRSTLSDFAQSRAQYELFRSQRLSALNQVLENEYQLRGLLRLPFSDGTRLVPLDAPTLAAYQPDWCTSVNDALALRPELVLARDDLKFRQLDLVNQRNLLLPDLRFVSTYNITGLGTHLDGGEDPTNAFHSLATDKFTNWSLGLNLSVPIGFRDAHSAVRAARLNLARSYGVLKDQEIRAQRQVAQQYRQLQTDYHQIEILRSQRQANGVFVDARYREFLIGRSTLDILLEAQRDYASSLSSEYQAIGAYNDSLTRFAFVTGTIMQRDNVVIGEGPLPQCAQVRAVEHARQRSKALVLHERAEPVVCPLKYYNGQKVTGLPALPEGSAPAIPSMLEGLKALNPLPEELPAPPGDAGSTPMLSAITTQGATVTPAPSAPMPAPSPVVAAPLPSPPLTGQTSSGAAPMPIGARDEWLSTPDDNNPSGPAMPSAAPPGVSALSGTWKSAAGQPPNR